MKSINAQVSYKSLCPARDLTDASPKYLGATYFRPKGRLLAFGGFIVRVYFAGRLQGSRASPQDLLTLFPAEDQSASAPNAIPGP